MYNYMAPKSRFPSLETSAYVSTICPRIYIYERIEMEICVHFATFQSFLISEFPNGLLQPANIITLFKSH